MTITIHTPATVYATPDGWGDETFYGSREATESDIAELRKLGDDYADADLGDCDAWTLHSVAGGVATYSRTWHATRDGRGHSGTDYVQLPIADDGAVGPRAISSNEPE